MPGYNTQISIRPRPVSILNLSHSHLKHEPRDAIISFAKRILLRLHAGQRPAHSGSQPCQCEGRLQHERGGARARSGTPITTLMMSTLQPQARMSQKSSTECTHLEASRGPRAKRTQDAHQFLHRLFCDEMSIYDGKGASMKSRDHFNKRRLYRAH